MCFCKCLYNGFLIQTRSAFLSPTRIYRAGKASFLTQQSGHSRSLLEEPAHLQVNYWAGLLLAEQPPLHLLHCLTHSWSFSAARRRAAEGWLAVFLHLVRLNSTFRSLPALMLRRHQCIFTHHRLCECTISTTSPLVVFSA